MTTQERVAAGCVRLDKVFPGWASNIDPYSIQQWHPRYCILGQLFGDWCLGQDSVLGGHTEQYATLAANCGFIGTYADTAHGDMAPYHELDLAWREEVLRRQSL